MRSETEKGMQMQKGYPSGVLVLEHRTPPEQNTVEIAGETANGVAFIRERRVELNDENALRKELGEFHVSISGVVGEL